MMLNRNYFLMRNLLKRLVIICLEKAPANRKELLSFVSAKYMGEVFPSQQDLTVWRLLHHHMMFGLADALEKMVNALIRERTVIDDITEEDQDGTIVYKHTYRLAQATTQ